MFSAATSLEPEICAYAVISNHYHVVFHINREHGESWDIREVLERWTISVKCSFHVGLDKQAITQAIEEYDGG